MLKELVDYTYYILKYGGDSSIPRSSFKEYSLKASSKINYFTFNRINSAILDDNIRNTTCEICNLLFVQDKLQAKLNDDKSVKASETVGPHSVTYVNKTNLQIDKILSKEELDKECYRICYEHLAHTGLMYRGVR